MYFIVYLFIKYVSKKAKCTGHFCHKLEGHQPTNIASAVVLNKLIEIFVRLFQLGDEVCVLNEHLFYRYIFLSSIVCDCYAL